MPFRFETAFPRTDPECAPRFSRSFEHIDWIDGESIVQAESTAMEEGFNSRFRKIIADLDALGDDARRALACAARMREGLHGIVRELEAELERLGRPPEDWRPLTLQNGWRHDPAHGGAFFRDRGMVHLRGRLQPPAGFTGLGQSIIFSTLPPSHRPDAPAYYLPIHGTVEGNLQLVQLFVNGDGWCLAGSGLPRLNHIWLDGAAFRAAD